MKNYYKINEISKLYNIGVDSLRYYEEIGILHPMRGKNRYRQYTTSDIYRLNMIRDLRNLGFSMKHIAAYLENRTIENSLAFMEEEERIVDQRIQELKKLKKDLQRRKASLLKSTKVVFDKMELLHLNQRKCVSLATDDIHDDIEYQLIKLSKEYEDNIYTIGNFHTGCFLNIEDKNHIHPSSVFIMEDTLTDYEFTLPEGLYLNLYYQGPRDPDYQHLKMMIEYCQQHHYTIVSEAMEFFVIDVHETRQKEEYITQLQLQVCQTK